MSERTLSQVEAAPAISCTPLRSGFLQRKCACGNSASLTGDCTGCGEQQILQRHPSGQAGPSTVPPIVHEVLRSPGQPLDSGTRAFFEPRFGHDFSQVRVHEDARAAKSARAVNALAYTVGRNIVFAEGQHEPSTSSGRQLLAHELSHVLQQHFAQNTDHPLRVGEEASSSEREADNLSQMILSSPIAQTFQARTTPLSLQRVCDNGTWKPVSNGCTVPGFAVRLLGGSDADNPARGTETYFSKPDKKTGPCDKHDVCYQTPTSAPDDKNKCDEEFKKDMLAVCQTSTEPTFKTSCYKAALRYYQGVQVFGGIAYRQNQRKIRRCQGKNSETQKGED